MAHSRGNLQGWVGKVGDRLGRNCVCESAAAALRKLIDRIFASRQAKADEFYEQLLLILRNLYSYPIGQIPAYVWNFSDVNPPVHAWATLLLYEFDKPLG
jgi:hypothetical protein